MQSRISNPRPAAARAAALLLLLLLVAAGGGAGSARGQVSVPLSASDRAGRPVEGLRPEDLRVTVEGAEQKGVSLSPRAGEPLHVVLLLDTSASQEQILPFARAAAADLVRALLLRPGARSDAAVVSFTGDVKVVSGLTADLGALERAIGSVEFVPPQGYVGGGILVGGGGPLPKGTVVVPNPSGKGVIVVKDPAAANDPALRAGSTAIWDSLVRVCEDVLAGAKDGRRLVVLFSDGVDTSSRIKQGEAVERLVRGGVSVYSIGMGDTNSFDGVLKEDLRKLSQRTGGRAFFPKKVDELKESLEAIRGELLSAYALALAPAASKGEGKLNRLRVEVVNPELRRRGVELAHPHGFYAGPAVAPGARR